MNKRGFVGVAGSMLLLFALLVSGPLAAQEDRPFVEHKIVLQISDMDPFKQTLVLNVAGNILKAYGAAVKEKYRFFSYGDAMFIE